MATVVNQTTIQMSVDEVAETTEALNDAVAAMWLFTLRCVSQDKQDATRRNIEIAGRLLDRLTGDTNREDFEDV